MRVGEGLTSAQQRRIDDATRNAERSSGLNFSIYVGAADDDARGYAVRLHERLDDPDRSVLVMCDPDQRILQIVTGAKTRRYLDDVACRLAAASMQSSFAGGDLVGGLTIGIQQLGESARHPQTLHRDEP